MSKTFDFPNLREADDGTIMSNRHDASVSDDLRVYRAKIYKCMGIGDDRLQVLPIALYGIPRDEMENLPRFPPLIKGEVYTGRSISENGEDKADSVWVMSTPDFSVGYVLGKCNSFGENTKKKWPYSYAFNSAFDFLFGRRVDVVKDYVRFDIIKSYSTDKGGMVEIVDHENGDWILFNTSGTVIALTQKKLFLRVGTPPENPAQGPVAFSMISMTADKIEVKTPNLLLDGKQITTGRHGMHLVGAPTTSPIITYGGAVMMPIDNTHG
jgi:hypothetical protein